MAPVLFDFVCAVGAPGVVAADCEFCGVLLGVPAGTAEDPIASTVTETIEELGDGSGSDIVLNVELVEGDVIGFRYKC
jgi:hypothetical protein